MHPTEIHLHEARRVLEIHWDDGERSLFSLTYLRGWCPCAKCQGHFQGVTTFHRVPGVRLLGVEPVGNYAMRPQWSDGHKTGMLSWSYLRSIEAGPPAEGPSNQELLETEDPEHGGRAE